MIADGTTTTIRAPRQMGKTSLLVRGVQDARKIGQQVVYVDLQRVNEAYLSSLDGLLRYIADEVAQRLNLDAASVERVWSSSRGAQDKLSNFLERQVLAAAETPILLAIDEADRLLNVPYKTDFFGLLRAWDSNRAYDEIWQRLNLVLVISTHPHLLIIDVSQSPFKVGLRIHSYITGAADEELLHFTLAGEYCNVLAARQMGKSSLMVRTADRLKAHGVRSVVIDLTAIGADVTIEEWYFGLVSRLAQQLRLQADEQAWWQAHAERGPVQRFSDFAREIGLEEVRDPIVVFTDEIDSTLRLKFTDDFFAAIRAMYNACSSDAPYRRLTFVLLGVARPSDLVKDRARTPYNIGVSVDLTDFTYDEVKEVFVPVLNASQAGQGESILQYVLRWTEGQPYLTQKLCAEAATQLKGRIAEGDIDQLVTQLFLAEEARRESNLQAIRDRILSSPYKAPMLKIYRRVLADQRVADEERSLEKNELKLTGLVRRTPQGVLAVRNSVYSYVFDAAWVKANLPVNYAKRIAIVAIIVALLATGALVLALANQQAQAVDVQAKTLVDQFNNSLSQDVRLSSLAGLFKLGDTQASQARDLFFGLTQAERLALIDPANPQNVQTELADVIAGVYQYPHCTGTPDEAALLNSMNAALKKIHAVSLSAEIELWLQARALAATNPIAAIGVYSTALTTSQNDGRANPNLLFERGMSYSAA